MATDGSMLQERYPNGMPPDQVVRIIRAVAEALDYAHQQQLLHRDVKPQTSCCRTLKNRMSESLGRLRDCSLGR
jgi:hypothetical protein